MKQTDWTEQLRQRMSHFESAVPSDLWDGIEASVRPARRVALWRWWAGIAAMLLLMGGVGYLLLPPSDGPMVVQRRPSAADAPVATVPSAPPATVFTPSAAPVPPPKLATQTHDIVPQAATSLPEDEATRPAPSAEGNAIYPKSDTSEPVTSPPPSPRHSPVPRQSTPRRHGHGAPSLTVQGANLLAGHALSATSTAPMYLSPHYAAMPLPSGSAPMRLLNYQEKAQHHVPIVLGLQARWPLTERLWLQSGVSYTLLRSTFSRQTAHYGISEEQRLHYVGVPLQAGCTVWQKGALQAYLAAGATADVCVASSMTTNGARRRFTRDRMQFSLTASAGADYALWPQFSVFVQPSLGYYPDNGSALQNIYKERPCQFSLQLGVRFR